MSVLLRCVLSLLASLGAVAAQERAVRPTLADGVTQLAGRLWPTVAEQPGDVCLAPYMVHGALALAAQGAAGETRTELLRLLGGQALLDDHRPARARLLASAASATACSLLLTRRLFAHQDLTWREDFLGACARDYAAGCERLDFNDPTTARTRINAWVAESTAGRLPELLPATVSLAGTALVLADALHLRASWLQAFDPQLTQPGVFHGSAGPATVAFMHATRALAVDAAPGRPTRVILPLHGGFSCHLILPEPGAGVSQSILPFLCMLTAEAPAQQVAVDLPRLRLDRLPTVDLLPALRAAGMSRACGSDADFSGMLVPGQARDLSISNVFHGASLSLDETGAEAAAAVAVVMKRGGPASQPLRIRFDRPFLLVIVHDATRIPLLVARVAALTAR